MEKLKSVLAEIQGTWGTPGIAVALMDGKETFTHCQGVLRLDHPQVVTPDTIFCPASVSKVIAIAAVMQLAEQGRIGLDTPVACYLPDFRMADERYRQITARMLLSHTAGMPDESEADYNLLFASADADEEASQRYIQAQAEKELIAAPGERFYYSNIGYSLLGYLVSQVSGDSFEAYVQQNILAPCGMRDSTFLLAEVDPARLAMPHIRAPQLQVSPLYPYYRGDAPSSNLHTTLNDLCRFAKMCLNRGEMEGKHILQEESFEQMWSLHAHRGGVLYRDMGLGWNLGCYQGADVVSHGGQGAGLSAFLVLLPARGQAAVLLINEESEVRQRYLYALLDALLGLEPQVGPVSWLAPVSRALAQGGLDAARDTARMLLRERPEGVEFDEGGLVRLGQQLIIVGKVKTAIEMFQLNLEAFPGSEFTLECLVNAERVENGE